jgi:hypothetical protein
MGSSIGGVKPPGIKKRALTATIAAKKINRTISGAMYSRNIFMVFFELH